MRSVGIVTGLLLGSVLLFGCGEEATQPAAKSPYSDALTAPDSLFNDLRTAFRLRDCSGLRNLFGPDFRFVPAQNDVTPDIPPGYWELEGELAPVCDLFEDPEVRDVRLYLDWNPATEVVLGGMPALLVLVTASRLDVFLADGTVERTSRGAQYCYFRFGREDLGQDPARLYLVQWEYLGDSSPAG